MLVSLLEGAESRLDLLLDPKSAWLLDHVPENARWVHYIRDYEAPRLECRSTRSAHPILFGEIQALDAFPPALNVIHHQLHHEIAGEAFDVIFLKQESERAEFHRGKRGGNPKGCETQINIEAQAGFKFLCGDEWPQRNYVGS